MTPVERAGLRLVALLAVLTGVLYGGLRYFGARPGEFGPEAHPWQGTAQHLHVLAVLVFALGGFLRAHALPLWQAGGPAGRWTGAFLALALGPMVLSGYGVQVVVEPSWRSALAWIHGATSLAFLAGLLAHGARAWRERGPADRD